jgi:hypothetical protein
MLIAETAIVTCLALPKSLEPLDPSGAIGFFELSLKVEERHTLHRLCRPPEKPQVLRA